MEIIGACRCCLAEGVHRDLNTSYIWLDHKEIYSDMLKECFNITITPSEQQPCGICEECVKTLRSSIAFKHQVLDAEKEFLKRISSDSKEEKPVTVKLEPKPDDDDDSDDYFLADAVTIGDVAFKKIKKEKKSPVKKRQETKKAKSKTKKPEKKVADWSSDKLQTLVTRIASSMNTCDIPEIKPSKSRKIILGNEPLSGTKINLIWSRNNSHKHKHRENLQTILKYTNATPFKNKSLLGFICGYCEAAYQDPTELRLHTETDHGKERLNFKNNFDMTEYHVKMDVTDLTCNLCDEKMANLTQFKEHIVKIHEKTVYNDIKDHILQFKLKKGDIYDCALCSSTYETFKMLKQHMNKHYSNYSCNKCDTSFATKRSLNAHYAIHEDGSFKCEHCEKVFSSRAKKHYHVKMKHLGTRNISNCPFCNESFRSYYQRNQHMVKVHNSEAQYKCNVCDKAYILKSLLMYHIKKNHLMERNCQCTECGYRFFSKKALKAHMVKHTGERIYACEVCHKSYARKYTLREHMRIHNNDRRFKCEVCGMTFVQKCSLKSHLLSNHGISMAASDITSV